MRKYPYFPVITSILLLSMAFHGIIISLPDTETGLVVKTPSPGIPTTDREATRALDWAEWVDGNHPISIDGNAEDWATYTQHAMGTGSNTVNLTIANDNSYLYICANAISDVTDTEQKNDKFQAFFDGDNDNTAPTWINDQTANENTKDNWFVLNGDRDMTSDETDAYNDAGLINKRDNGQICLWYNQGTWIDEWGYQWRVGFNGNPQPHMIYEIKIPFSKWNWHAGDPIGAGFQVTKAAGGNPSLIGKYPAGFSLDNIGGWKDLFLATQNDRPSYSNPKSTPSNINNDGINETLLTVEATDPDGSISHVSIDLTEIGGGSEVSMMDDGSHGDVASGDGVYSYKTSVSTSKPAATYELPFTITDDHTPNVGTAYGAIRLTVTQANRAPEIKPGALSKVTILEDQSAAFIDLTEIFYDPDAQDVMTYFMKTNASWDSQYSSPLAEYRVLINDTIKIVPEQDRFGTDALLLKVRDVEGLWVDAPFSLTVIIQPTNDPPRITEVCGTDIIITPLSLRAPEDTWTAITFKADDIDGDPLDYKLNISDAIPDMRKGKDFYFYRDNGTLTIRPSNQHVGFYSLLLTVEDDNGGEDSLEISLEIENTNDQPSLEKISTMYVDQDEEMEIIPEATDDDIVYGDTLTYSTNFTEEVKVPLTENNFRFDRETGVFWFKPDRYMVQTYFTHIRVEDASMDFHQRDFKIMVININDPPEAPSFVHTGGEKNLTVRFTAGDCSDPDNDLLTYMWNFGDGSRNPNGEDLVEVEHSYAEEGTYTVMLSISDGQMTNSSTRVIQVTAPDDNVVPPGKKFRYWGRVTDARNNPVGKALISVEQIKGDAGDFVPSTSTDSKGNFELFLPPGSYTLRISKKDFDINSTNFEILDRDVEEYFTLSQQDTVEESTEGAAEISPLLLVLIVSILLISVAIILIIVIKKKKQRKEEAPIPHHIMVHQYPPVPPGGPPVRQGRLPPVPQHQAPPPGSRPMPPPVHSPYSPEALSKGNIAVSGVHSNAPRGKQPEPEKVELAKPRIVKPPRPPKFKGKKEKGSRPGEGRGKLTDGTGDMLSLPPKGMELKSPDMDVEPEKERMDIDAEYDGISEVGERVDTFGPGEPGSREKMDELFDIPEPIITSGKKASARDQLREMADGDKSRGGDKSAIKGIFDGLDDRIDKPGSKVDSSPETLAKIPVKQIAISKETGEQLRLCDICKGYFEPSHGTCPYCGGQQIEEEETDECPSCGSEVAMDMIFCNKCGSNLRKVRAKRFSNRDGSRGVKDGGPADKVECPKCGKMLQRNMKLCNACGAPLDPSESSTRNNKHTPEPNFPTQEPASPAVTVHENVECYQCGGLIPVTTLERPVVVICPGCGTQGQLQ